MSLFPELSPIENSHNDLRYWFVSDPNAVGSIGNFRFADRVAAVVSEDMTDDGHRFQAPVFGGEALDGVFATLDAEDGAKVFGYIAARLAGKKTATAILDDDSAGVVGLWNLPDGRVAILAGDRGSDNVQELWDEACRLAKVPPYEEGRVHSSSRISADMIASLGGDLAEAAQAIGQVPPKSRPRLG